MWGELVQTGTVGPPLYIQQPDSVNVCSFSVRSQARARSLCQFRALAGASAQEPSHCSRAILAKSMVILRNPELKLIKTVT